ncbi:MAG: TonB-dependent receptor [Bacteroidales bacterium]|nr:TonB-dependent receptor [Bacteroidales bacterium]
MRGFSFSAAIAALLLQAMPAFSQTVSTENGEKVEKLDSVVVSVSRAGASTPVTFTMLGKEDLRKANPINSLPMVLNLQPSVVTYNEGGTGLGNSAMTVRGSKGSQINVTLNGITLNDSESQEVFWVNIPSLTSLISSVQLQRGLGTSANGAGSFGASVNMSTASVTPDPFTAVEFSGGSWNTFMTSVAAGTGLTDTGLYFNGAFSYGRTDGYIRNADVDSKSAFLVLGWMGGKSSLRLTYLMGDQRSGITWDGITLEQYAEDRRQNDAGVYYDDEGNIQYYPNQTDNYTQHHAQLNYTQLLGEKLTWTTTLNYTRGDGYDEYYKTSKKLKNYGFTPAEIGNFPKSDLTYRKKMGNNYYVVSSDLRYRTDGLNITGGINLSTYEGNHFGEILWVKTFREGYDYKAFNDEDRWYRNASHKKEVTGFLRTEWTPVQGLTAYADLQLRHISLNMAGHDSDYYEMGNPMAYDKKWNFFNPRAGVTYRWNYYSKAYASIALGHREPGRSDIKENIKGDLSPISPEKMLDFEAGYEFTSSKFSFGANIYLMEYWDMLLETGKLSSSGYAIKDNVPRSWRRGVELTGAWTPAPWVRFDANATLSTNKIDDYTSYVEVWDPDFPGETFAINYGRTTMLLSPSTVGMMQVALSPWKLSGRGSLKSTTFTLNGKWVGKQYIDSSERKEMEIPGYFVANLSLGHEFNVWKGVLGLTGYVNNLFSNLYYAYGWRWEGYTKSDGELSTGVGVYPQPPVNFMLKLSYRF